VTKYNIPSQVIYRQANSARFYSPSGKDFRVYRPETQACILNRSAFDRLLAERARVKGAQYKIKCKTENIYIKPDRLF
jgi:flavin-dependent dehydrogenase